MKAHKKLWEAALKEGGESWVSSMVTPGLETFKEIAADFLSKWPIPFQFGFHENDPDTRLYMLFFALYFADVDSATEDVLIEV